MDHDGLRADRLRGPRDLPVGLPVAVCHRQLALGGWMTECARCRKFVEGRLTHVRVYSMIDLNFYYCEPCSRDVMRVLSGDDLRGERLQVDAVGSEVGVGSGPRAEGEKKEE